MDNATWYKDAVIYELHVRAFADSDGDGIGDFRGLTARLDYLADLGVTALWLLPFYPSPLKDDGYDIADYMSVNPAYGTLEDFDAFLEAAHRRGLRVITELVVNHTSDQHAWFQRARHAPPGSPERDFYVWSDTPERYADARIIFKDFEASNWSWDPVAHAYFWHRFYSHQPDLNFDAPQVHEGIREVLDFWLGKGVDGLRLDAVPYLYEREGTNCENLPETHAYLRELRAHVDRTYPGRMLLAEANQWPEDAISYFGDGDECHMAFHFPVMPRLFMAIRMEDRFPIVDILQQTPPLPVGAQWAMFLRNHDELTLEMVTDEERDYMYRVYAHEPQMRINLGIRRRLAPLLGNDRRRIELMNALLFALPGTPVLYYGDEIGMGDNVFLGDRNGVRTPMQWNADRNGGFSRASPQRLYLPMVMDSEYRYESLNVEAQLQNLHSLLWWTRRLIALRRRNPAFGRGTLEMLAPANRKVLAFVRRHEDRALLLVFNLSRYVQPVELDLPEFRGTRPIEMFGRGRLPEIGDAPYVLTLAPHGFVWLDLGASRRPEEAETAADLPAIAFDGPVADLVAAGVPEGLEDALPGYLEQARWFRSKARTILGASVQRAVPLPPPPGDAAPAALLLLVDVAYTEGEPDVYVIPVALAEPDDAERILAEAPADAIARVRRRVGREALLHDASGDRRTMAGLLAALAAGLRVPAGDAELVFRRAPAFERLLPAEAGLPEAQAARAEQSNSSAVFGNRVILKLFRRVEPGQNPEVEVSRFLTERAGFPHVPPVAGSIVLAPRRGEEWVLGAALGYVENQGDAWRYTLDALEVAPQRVQGAQRDRDLAALGAPPAVPLADLARGPLPEASYEGLGTYGDAAGLLGRRTAEMHVALASKPADPAFAPEPFGLLYQRSLYQSMRTLAANALAQLRRALPALDAGDRALAEEVVALEEAVYARFRRLTERKLDAWRMRHHGDYHLGQVLYTGGDFAIIDFEGEPARPLGERRIKRSPLRDVAGMVRSFAYAAEFALRTQRRHGAWSAADLARLDAAAEAWCVWAATAFLHGYLEAAGEALAVPRDPRDFRLLLDTFLLEKAVYELGYELNNRPDWVRIPLEGLRALLGEESAGGR